MAAAQKSGQEPSEVDWGQLSEAMTRTASGGVYYTDNGPLNAFALTIIGQFRPPSAYFDGMCVTWKPTLSNTGAATINVGGLGPKPLVRGDGSPLKARDVSGVLAEAIFERKSRMFG